MELLDQFSHLQNQIANEDSSLQNQLKVLTGELLRENEALPKVTGGDNSVHVGCTSLDVDSEDLSGVSQIHHSPMLNNKKQSKMKLSNNEVEQQGS